MRLRRICLHSFGIIRDQVMESLHPGLVIIAGPNRAGKTTLMTALRYLGYGLPRKDFLPPAPGGEHNYDVDLELADRSRYNLHLLGYGRPRVSPLGSHREREVEEIFNHLEGYTYRQVFTISLDELRRIPEGPGAGEERRLQLVLLGGGWIDALHLARFKGEFEKTARKIGGTRGAQGVLEFKPYWETIREGVAERDEANKQLESYYLKVRELEELTDMVIPRIEKKRRDLQVKKETLEIIKDHYRKYEQMLLLDKNMEQDNRLLQSFPEDSLEQGRQLRGKYDRCMDEYEDATRGFNLAAAPDRLQAYLEKKEILPRFERNLSGWREKLAHFRQKKDKYTREEKELEKKLSGLNAQWGRDLTILDRIPADSVNREGLREEVEEYRKTAQELERLAIEKEPIQERLDRKLKEKEGFTKENQLRPKSLSLLAGLGLALVLLLALLSPLLSLGAGAIWAAALLAHFFSYQSKERDYKNALGLLGAEITGLENELLALSARGKTLQVKRQSLEDSLARTVTLFNLPSTVAYARLTDFHSEIAGLKERYDLWLETEQGLEDQSEELGLIFEEISPVLHTLDLGAPEAGKDFSRAEEIFTAIEKAVTNLPLARELEKAELEKIDLEKKITALLQKENPAVQTTPAGLPDLLAAFINRGIRHRELKEKESSFENLRLDLITSLNVERRKKVLTKDEPARDVLDAYAQYFNAYSSLEEIEGVYRETIVDLEELNGERITRSEHKAVLEKEIRDLSSDEKLQQAQRKITAARNKLEVLAERYARYRLAELLVDEVHKIFIEKTRGTILGSAGSIFREITSGDYDSVALPETILEGTATGLDFEVEPAREAGPLMTDQLSRATREQLFLAVRLSRIRSMDPLPVIFDDSLVNFDPAHSRQTARLIANLAETHQVFVLTCHPEFIHHLQAHARSAQYWGLDNGRISGPFDAPDEATNLLKP